MPTREERKEASRLARRVEDRRVAGTAEQDPTPERPGKRRGRSPHTHPYGMEMRLCPDRWPRHQGSVWLCRDTEWHPSWRWYDTIERRDRAMAVLQRKDAGLWEYRPCRR